MPSQVLRSHVWLREHHAWLHTRRRIPFIVGEGLLPHAEGLVYRQPTHRLHHAEEREGHVFFQQIMHCV